ncbi:MAG TPA: glycosyltransferase family 9 protein [Candidatus Andersenbacteria bacterium]|nr:glycosyltransferase family 9 protein [Candidatus Andersenbacteria bacterium]
MKRFLVRHLGNMGDMVFIVPPVLETLKKVYPGCHITFITASGFKNKHSHWGKRNQGGFCLHLMMTNPHIDQLVHWHDTALALDGSICHEDGQSFPTWSRAYYEQQKASRQYDGVFELEFGLKITDNPLQRMYEVVGVVGETYSKYQLYLTDSDRFIAGQIMASAPRPRIMLLEGLEGNTTRGWDPGKIPALIQQIKRVYGTEPIWFGGKYTPIYQGRPLTLRENIALLMYADAGIGVLSGPLHFAAAVGLPTITLYADHPLRRAAPAYFLNPYVKDPYRRHRTILGPAAADMKILKTEQPQFLTVAETARQDYQNWLLPGRQATKSSLAAITVDEIMQVLADMLPPK